MSLLTFAALALFALVLAYWTWIWFAPRAAPRAEVAPAESGSLAAASLVFGRVERGKNTAAPTGIAIKLLGVVAASAGRRGYAVLQLEAKQILAVHEGEDVTPGLRLAEVRPDHVILERGGVRETLAFPEKKAPLASVAQTTAPSAAPRAAEAAAPQAPAPQAAEPVVPQAAQPAARRARRGRGNESD